MKKRALVTGITGQDGSYLAEWLLRQGYEVHGALRPGVSGNRGRIRHLESSLSLHVAELNEASQVLDLLKQVQPQELYNLAAPSFVPSCWSSPLTTAHSIAFAVTHLLEAIRLVDPRIRFFQAGSSEMFGPPTQSPQDERTPFAPRSPYAVAKAYGHWITASYRESYNLFACSGILFNHESPRRGPEFVTRKITQTVAQIKCHQASELRLGNLQARRDWGFAGDYVQAMWLMLQQDQAEDYVIGTGETHSVEQFLDAAFSHVGLNWHDYVVIDPKFYRPVEVEAMIADPRKAQRRLSWQPRVGFQELVAMMVDADLAQLSPRSDKTRQDAQAA